MSTAESQPSRRSLNPDRDKQLPLWVLPTLLLIGFGPLLFTFFANLWRFEVHQFFPLSLLGAGFLAWRGAREVPRPLVQGSLWITASLTLLALALLTLATWLWSPWLGVGAALTVFAGTAWWLGGRQLVIALLPAWIMLLTVIPPPLRLDARFALALQQWAVAGSNRVLDLLAIPHLRTGNILEIPGQRLLVEEACSGINSVLFMTAACVFYVLWRRRSLLFLLPLYVMTIGCVLFGNLIRITSGAWLLFNFHVDLFSGWRHEALGLVLTAFYLLFIIAADALLGKISGADVASARASVLTRSAGAVTIKELLAGYTFSPTLKVIAGYLALLCLGQLYQCWHFSAKAVHERRINPSRMNGSARFSLPTDVEGWILHSDLNPTPKKTAFEDGVYSHIWRYETKGLVATVSLDYPFFDYHDVRICYSGAGWNVDESKLQHDGEGPDSIPEMKVILSKEDGLKGTLFYSTVNEGGKWLDESGRRALYDAHGRSFEGGLLDRITQRLSDPENDKPESINYRIQLLVTTQGELDSKQLARVTSLFHQVRKLLAEQFVQQP